MHDISSRELKLGIIGGGQLGKMLLEKASDWNIQCHVIDPDPECSCAGLAYEFTSGDFSDYDTLYDFGSKLDRLTIEIEHVNTDALLQLEKEGKKIFPNPTALQIIQDKSLQKLFYRDHGIPTGDFKIFSTENKIREALQFGEIKFPFVQKLSKSGYDGHGVQIVKNENDLNHLLRGASVIEDLIEIEKEIAVIAARDFRGNTICFPPVEMEFHPTANLVEFLSAPASLTQEQEARAKEIATKTISAFEITGILAVEMFLTKTGEILINEVAPRPHNSGHHTIEANFTSQYEQLLRCIFDLPLGSTAHRSHAVMVNLLGAENYSGEAKYRGLDDCLKLEGVYVHLYGKKITRPFRKMGHVTILDNDLQHAKEKAKFVKENLHIIS